MSKQLLTQIRAEFKKAAIASKAPQMQAYMKSEMPYHGVASPGVKAICKALFKNLELSSAQEWQESVRALWDGARFREERYAALQLCGHRCARDFQTPKALPLYEDMIVSGAWWDYVDDIAAHRVGSIVLNYPAEMKPKMLQWSNSANIWKRRTSIICQLAHKDQIDLKLLYACIEPSLGSKEFFLQKAIGWALRQHAWRDPREVKRYVAANKDRLAPLSQREALKNLKNK